MPSLKKGDKCFTFGKVQGTESPFDFLEIQANMQQILKKTWGCSSKSI